MKKIISAVIITVCLFLLHYFYNYYTNSNPINMVSDKSDNYFNIQGYNEYKFSYEDVDFSINFPSQWRFFNQIDRFEKVFVNSPYTEATLPIAAIVVNFYNQQYYKDRQIFDYAKFNLENYLDYRIDHAERYINAQELKIENCSMLGMKGKEISYYEPSNGYNYIGCIVEFNENNMSEVSYQFIKEEYDKVLPAYTEALKSFRIR